jgi:hypothetical protein
MSKNLKSTLNRKASRAHSIIFKQVKKNKEHLYETLLIKKKLVDTKINSFMVEIIVNQDFLSPPSKSDHSLFSLELGT